jgi:hypothetical protein
MPALLDVKFDPSKGGKLIVNFKFTGLLFIPYSFKYFSSDKMDAKVIVQGEGNNVQPHDDFFDLSNPVTPPENIAKHDGRIVLLSATAISASGTGTQFVATIEVYQDSNGAGIAHQNLIGTNSFPGNLSGNPADSIVSLAVKLVQ